MAESSRLGPASRRRNNCAFPMATRTGVCTTTEQTASTTDSYVSSGTWVGEMGGEFTLALSVRSQSFKLVVQRPLVAISVGSSSDEVSSGTIGGIVPVESLLAEVRQAVGHASSALCDLAAFETLAVEVRGAADSLADGTQDPSRVCDAISVGLGFDAVTVVRPPDHGEIAQQATPLADPCSATSGEGAGCHGTAGSCLGVRPGSCSTQDGCYLSVGASSSTSDEPMRWVRQIVLVVFERNPV